MNRKILLDWARERDCSETKSSANTRQDIFDEILAELINTIDSGWGLTQDDADRLWRQRMWFMEKGNYDDRG